MNAAWRSRLSDGAALAGLGLFAFWITIAAGQRGFFAYDQSIVFDGGYRIFSGQVPYKDFLLWTGPIAYALQAAFFWCLGVNYTAYLVSAAVFNVAAAYLAVAVVRVLFPTSRILAYLAGLLTAIWFYPPFSTFAAEQTAFFFSLAALWLTLWTMRSIPTLRWTSAALACGAGVLSWIAVLSKQQAGLYLLPLYPALLWIADLRDRRRAIVHCVSFLLGILVISLIFWWWLAAASNPENFVRYALEIPGQLGWERIFRKGVLGLLKAFLIGVGPRSIRPVVVVMELITLATAWIAWRRAQGRWDAVRPYVLAALVCAALTHFQHVMTYTMENQSIIGLPFVGLIVALGVGSLRNAGKIAVIAVALWAVGVPAVVGTQVTFTRKAHDPVAGAAFSPTPIAIPAWKPLRWGQPTVLHGTEIREADVVQLYWELMKRGRNFFIFPDFTIFYGLTGRPSPQPIVAFNKGLTYPDTYDPELDARVVRALAEHQVELIVLEEVSARYGGNSRRTLADFPALEAYLKSAFKEMRRIGIFTLYERSASEN